MPSINPVSLLNRRRRASHLSQSSSGSLSSAYSAAASMSEEEVDNFRSMRGKSGYNTSDLSQHMSDDVFDLSDRLEDVQKSREMEKRLSDTTGQAFNILVTSNDVRLMHVDERGHYHFNHFNSTKRPSDKPSAKPIKQRWRIIDDEDAEHTFVSVSPSMVTVYHADGVWQCRRTKGRVWELEDSKHSRPISKRIPRPGGKKHDRQQRVWRLYSDVDLAASDRSSNASPQEAQLCANTPGEKGEHHIAHKSFYHDLW